MNKGKTLIGNIVSKKTDKTVIVEVARMIRHPLYKKSIRRTRRFAVHTEDANLMVGDTVRLRGTRPISKTKHFRAVEKVNL